MLARCLQLYVVFEFRTCRPIACRHTYFCLSTRLITSENPPLSLVYQNHHTSIREVRTEIRVQRPSGTGGHSLEVWLWVLGALGLSLYHGIDYCYSLRLRERERRICTLPDSTVRPGIRERARDCSCTVYSTVCCCSVDSLDMSRPSLRCRDSTARAARHARHSPAHTRAR